MNKPRHEDGVPFQNLRCFSPVGCVAIVRSGAVDGRRAVSENQHGTREPNALTIDDHAPDVAFRFGDFESDDANLRKDSRMIRKYHERDLDDLLAAWAAASEVAHPFLTAEFLASERRNIPELYLPNAETWVFEDGGRVVGFVALIGNEVGALFVHPRHQKVGIGRRLMDKAAGLCGELEVEVFVANAIGRAFYAKYGFDLHEEKVHEPTGKNVLRLRFSPPKPAHEMTADA